MTGAVRDAVIAGMWVVVRRLDHLGPGAPKHGRRVAAELDLVDQDTRAGSTGRSCNAAPSHMRALREQLEAELQAVGHDALILADAHDDAQ